MVGRLRKLAWWRRSGWRLAVAVSLSGGLVLAGVAVREHDTQALDQRICQHINRLDTALLTVLNRSYEGLPANPYYRSHPEQLRTALANTGYAIHLIKNARC